jgi:hypothetical protein
LALSGDCAWPATNNISVRKIANNISIFIYFEYFQSFLRIARYLLQIELKFTSSYINCQELYKIK